jgi:murein L,D-transpeptidase YcbB/YkuD
MSLSMPLRPALPHYFFLVYLLFQNVAYAEDFSSLSSPALTTTVSQEITSILNTKQNTLLNRSNFEYRAEDVDALYKTTNYTPLWLGNSQNIVDVLAVLSNAAAQGLNPEDYSTAALQQKLPVIQLLKPESSADLALYDTALTVSLVRFLHDVHYGRINPHSLAFNIKLRTKKDVDFSQVIKTAINEGKITQLAQTIEPNLQQYRQLRSALATYREPVIAAQSSEKPHKKNKTNKIVNPAERITKIELAMERLRWLPETTAGQSIIVNIPAFQLWAIDATEQTNTSILNLNVVVGKALKNQTPIIMADMNSVEFMPYWNVPPSILKKEILPKLANNPGYLSGQNMEVVSLKGGGMRVRQRPGGKNALGRIKFIFPNSEGVYLHDTPSKSLFSRTRRDFSHGCVRVQNPSALAQFVLRNQEGWTQERISATLQNSTHHQVSLKTTIPVLFFYTTAFYEQNDKLTFYSDIYGHDATLLAALTKVSDVPDNALIGVPNEPSHTPTLEPDDSLLSSTQPPAHEPLTP